MRRSWHLAPWAFCVDIINTIALAALSAPALVVRIFNIAFPAPSAGLHTSGIPSLISTETFRRSLGLAHVLNFTSRLFARLFVGRRSGDGYCSSSVAFA